MGDSSKDNGQGEINGMVGPMLRDTEIAKRIGGIRMLEHAGAHRAILGELCRAMVTDPDEEVRTTADEVLSKILKKSLEVHGSTAIGKLNIFKRVIPNEQKMESINQMIQTTTESIERARKTLSDGGDASELDIETEVRDRCKVIVTADGETTAAVYSEITEILTDRCKTKKDMGAFEAGFFNKDTVAKARERFASLRQNILSQIEINKGPPAKTSTKAQTRPVEKRTTR